MDRLYALLSTKDCDPETRTITGIATTRTPDRQGDIFEPAGATFRNPLPLLLHHDKTLPVGQAWLTPGGPTLNTGLFFKAILPIVTDPGTLRDRVEEAWQSIKAGLFGISIGYLPKPGGVKALAAGGFHLLKTEIFELSLVTIPANVDATILTIKSLDAAHLPPRQRSAPAMTHTEKIQNYENKRAATMARMALLMAESDEEGHTLTGEKATEYDDLTLEVKAIDEHLVRARELERLNAAAALPVTTPVIANSAVPPVTRPIVSVREKGLQPAAIFTRYAMSLAAGSGDSMRAIEHAKQWRDTPEVELYVKAAVAPATVTDATWAKPLVPAFSTVAAEFIDLLRPATIVGRIPGLRKVPFNVSVPTQTGGGVYNWVGEGAPKPVTKLAFGTVTLAQYKIAGILTFTEELARSSSPDAEAIFRADMIAGIAQFMDQQFIDPAVAEVTGVKPASITNGVTGTPATADPLADIHILLGKFTTAGIPMSNVVLIMSESNAWALSTRLAGGTAEPLVPNLSVTGGTINGITVITSQTAGTNIIGVAPRYILYADDGGVTIDVSREASIQMSDAPDNPATATTIFRSFWQDNLVGLRAERFVAWKRSITAAVDMVTGASYTPA